MTSSFEPEDLFRRGLLSSIIGFKKKPPKLGQSPSTSRRSSFDKQCTSTFGEEGQVLLHSQIQAEGSIELTPFDIYREIISEAEVFQRSNTVTPQSEFSFSTPTSPIPMIDQSPLMSPGSHHLQPFAAPSHQFAPQPLPSMPLFDQSMMYPPAHPNVEATFENLGRCPVFAQQPQVFCPPPAYPGNTGYPFAPPTTDAHSSSKDFVYGGSQESLHAKLMNAINAQSTIEEFVKLVVSAVKKEEETDEESPEEILRRKRQQNNEAAARYRKRQKEARDQADSELSHLEERNRELKETVQRMQSEIELLKKAVLSSASINITAH